MDSKGGGWVGGEGGLGLKCIGVIADRHLRGSEGMLLQRILDSQRALLRIWCILKAIFLHCDCILFLYTWHCIIPSAMIWGDSASLFSNYCWSSCSHISPPMNENELENAKRNKENTEHLLGNFSQLSTIWAHCQFLHKWLQAINMSSRGTRKISCCAASW